jgi:nitronate monooxygenase
MPASWRGRVRIPAIAAPMFLASNPALAKACCRAGIIGCFPALNHRSTAGLAEWLDEMQEQLTERDAPYGVNLIVHKSNPRMEADLAEVVRHKVPLVITSLGAANELVDAIHSYGGVVFHDIVSVRHAEKAAKVGVDGLIPVSDGAGGHAGTINPFALVAEIRSVFPGCIALAGCISSGRGVAAARAGRGLRLHGHTFHRHPGSQCAAGVQANVGGIIRRRRLLHARDQRRPSQFPAPVDHPERPGSRQPSARGRDLLRRGTNHAKAWKDIWSGGQGTGQIHDVPSAGDCVRA